MAEDRCELTDLLVDQCAHCQGHDAPPEKVERVGGTLSARYVGTCVHCGDRFQADEPIALGWVDGGLEWCLADHTVRSS